MKILILGSGGREHAIATVLKNTAKEREDKIYLSPGNGGTVKSFINVELDLTPPFLSLIDFCQSTAIDLVVVGPEQYLCEGVVDALSTVVAETGLKIFGPSQAAARLESSKIFAKEVMQVAEVPTAQFERFNDLATAEQAVKGRTLDYVIKADGLCAGKGVVLPESEEESLATLQSFFVDKKFGEAGEEIIIEEKLSGQEVSILGFCDGETALLLPPSQDHKRAYDDDQGPNTGGMGVYTPVKFIGENELAWIQQHIFKPMLKAMKDWGTPFKGILYAGLMVSDENEGTKKINVIEFNVRFGDPECECVLPLLKSDLAEIMLACTDGSLTTMPFEVEEKAVCTVIMASGGYPGSYDVGKEISGLNEVGEKTLVFHAGTKQVKKGEQFVPATSGGRVLAVSTFAEDGESLKEVTEQCYQEVEKIKFEDAFYRCDIGKKGF